MKKQTLYKRILLKLSGEGLGSAKGALDSEIMANLAKEIKSVYDMGVQICIVVGGGNFWRGAKGVSKGVDRVTGDYIGMLATVMNALAFADVLEQNGMPARIMTALAVEGVGEVFNQQRVLRYLQKGKIVIFAGGTGSPFFTTDTCAVLRATEMGCDACLKSTQVDGIYDSDPVKNPKAKRYDTIDYETALNKKLGVMDLTAMALAQDAALPIVVFNQAGKGALANVVCGKGTYSVMK